MADDEKEDEGKGAKQLQDDAEYHPDGKEKAPNVKKPKTEDVRCITLRHIQRC